MSASTCRSAFVVVVGVLVGGGAIAASQGAAAKADPIAGTWTLNVAKSTFTPGPAGKSGTVTFETAGQGVHVVADLVDGTGAKVHTEYTANYDGKDYPITGSPVSDTVVLKRIDANTAERTDKKNGKAVGTYLRKLSADGKTMTVTQKGTGPDGKPFTNVLVFERK